MTRKELNINLFAHAFISYIFDLKFHILNIVQLPYKKYVNKHPEILYNYTLSLSLSLVIIYVLLAHFSAPNESFHHFFRLKRTILCTIVCSYVVIDSNSCHDYFKTKFNLKEKPQYTQFYIILFKFFQNQNRIRMLLF